MKIFREPAAPRPQLWLLPPSVEEFVGEQAPVRLFAEAFDALDCSGLYACYRGGGAPAYDPKMMACLLVFAYTQGCRSSRKIAELLEYDLRFMYLAQMARPDFRTICRFRRTHAKSLRDLFVESVRLCARLGLVLLEHVAVDGTKIQADVSGKCTFSEARVKKTEAWLEQAEVALREKAELALREAEEADQKEEAREEQAGGGNGGNASTGNRGDRLERRKKVLEAARELLEMGEQKSVAVTDPESRLMKTRAGNLPAYNAQAAVDGAHHVIVAADVCSSPIDADQLEGVVEQVRQTMGALPAQVTADCGYWNKEQMQRLCEQGVDVYVPEHTPSEASLRAREGWIYDEEADLFRSSDPENHTVLTYRRDREQDGNNYRIYRAPGRGGKELRIRLYDEFQIRMRQKLASEKGRRVYALRQQTAEPVFGCLKQRSGLRRFLLRGRSGACIEFLTACLGHNLLKSLRALRALRSEPIQPVQAVAA